MPIKKLDNESDTWATSVCRSAAMFENAGRYISIENGPMAESIPSMIMRKNFFLEFMRCVKMVSSGQAGYHFSMPKTVRR